jgi:hypothetical protein
MDIEQPQHFLVALTNQYDHCRLLALKVS